MLTPQEVSGRAFSKAAFGGYNMAMVDEFLDELTDDYTSLYKENAALKAKLKVLVDKVEEYRATEDSMRAALLTAQRMANTMVEEAEEKKKAVLAGAEDEARAKIGALQSDVELEQRRLNAAKAATAEFLQKTRELAQAQLALIERAPDLTPEEIAGGEKTEQKTEADVNAIEEKILASFRPAAEEAAPEKAQETAPAEEQSAPKAEEPKAEEKTPVEEAPAAPAAEEAPAAQPVEEAAEEAAPAEGEEVEVPICIEENAKVQAAVDYLKDIGDNMFGVGIPRLLAVAITGGSYKLWHNTFVSMAAGTLSYMGLLYLFSHVLTMA